MGSLSTICESNDSQINTSIESSKSFTTCEADLTELNCPIEPLEHEVIETSKTRECLNNSSENYIIPCILRDPNILSRPHKIPMDSHMVPSTTIPVRITVRDHRTIRNYSSGILSNRCNLRKIKISSHAPNTFLPSLFLSNLRSLVNKIDELSGTVSSLSLDIVVITETWLSPNVNNSAINLNGFSIFRRDRRDGRRGGGVCVYVNDRMQVVHLKELSHPEVESLWLLIKPKRIPRGFNSIILVAIYQPPKSDDRALLTHLIESLDSTLTSYPALAIIIAGDFNQFRHSQLCNSFSLKQVVKQATRGSNILDKIFTNASKFYNVPEILPLVGFSDHNSVLIKPLKQCINSRSTRMVRDTRSPNRKLVSEALSKKLKLVSSVQNGLLQ